MKKDVVRKLTSRKFWTAVGSFAALLIVALGGSEDAAVQATALIMAGAAVIAYIVGEGLTDAAAVDAGVADDAEADKGDTGFVGGLEEFREVPADFGADDELEDRR